MRQIFSFSFWLQALISTFFTMILIFMIKQLTARVNVPVISNIANAV